MEAGVVVEQVHKVVTELEAEVEQFLAVAMLEAGVGMGLSWCVTPSARVVLLTSVLVDTEVLVVVIALMVPPTLGVSGGPVLASRVRRTLFRTRGLALDSKGILFLMQGQFH